MTRDRTILAAGLVAFIATDGATAGRTVVRNANLVVLAAEAPTQIASGNSILVEDGRIAAIRPPSDEDLRPGDMLVDAAGAWLVAGFIDVDVGSAPPYSAITRYPLRGVTTLAGHFGASRIAWYGRLNNEAAIHGPALVNIPANSSGSWQPMALSGATGSPDAIARFLIAQTRDRAAALGLSDRGSITVGQRGDFVILAKNPLESPETLAEPIEVVIAGASMRRSAIETNRRMIAEADAAIAAQPAPSASEHLFLVESGGLRVGRLVIAKDGMRATDWWGPPVDQTTTWSITPTPASAGQWVLALTQSLTHGFTITMRIERRAKDTLAVAQLTAPEKMPSTETTLDATPEQPLLDPIGLVLRLRSSIAEMGEGTHRDVEVIEPVPEIGKVKVGVRTLRLARVAPDAVPVPVDAGERVLRLESRLGDPAKPVAEPSEPSIAGWIVIDDSGLPLRASLIAPEGITEYFVSLPQLGPPSAPQVKRD